MKRILLVGGGGHCRSVIDVIESEGRYSIAGIIDRAENIGKKILGYEIIGQDSDLPKLRSGIDCAVVTIGFIKELKPRLSAFDTLKSFGFELPVIVSPQAYVSKHSTIGQGTVIMHDVVINSGVKIGVNCILNTKSLIEHDSEIGDHCHISTGAIVNGGCIIHQGVFVGSGAVIVNGVSVSHFIKAGSLWK